jgi:glutamine synthetase
LRDPAPALQQLRQRGVETVILAGADAHGIMRGKRVPVAELARVAEHGVALCEVIWALPVDELEPVRPPAGHAGYFPGDGYPDMLAIPDLGSARIVPWHDHTALLLCDFVDHDGGAIALSPRAVLRSVVERARSMGFEPIVGVELELYLLRETPHSILAKRPSQLVAVQERPSVYGVVAGSRSWAATTATWSLDNRSAGLRAICRGEGATRVEHRQAGADANPYLAVAAALAAGLDGVRRACEPPAPRNGDVYALADGTAPALPATLAEATDLLDRSALARDWLGDDVVEHCVTMRRAELTAQAAAVTDWETSRYLEAL